MREAAAASAYLVGGGIGIALDNRHRSQWHLQLLGYDLLQHRIGTGAGVSRAGEQRESSSGVDAEHRARGSKGAGLAVIHADAPALVRRLLRAPSSRLGSGR